MLINHCLYIVLVLTTATFRMLQCSFTWVVRSGSLSLGARSCLLALKLLFQLKIQLLLSTALKNRQILKLNEGGESRAPD